LSPSKNLLRAYDNYFGATVSSLDGVYAFYALPEPVILDGVYGKETEEYFSPKKAVMSGASARINPFYWLEMGPFAYYYSYGKTEFLGKISVYTEHWGTKKKLIFTYLTQ
jgi:hypothetical protein